MTPNTRPSSIQSSAGEFSRKSAPESIAACITIASNSARGATAPTGGNTPSGHNTSRTLLPACTRSPSMRWNRSRSMPRRRHSITARGVRPSPQDFSRPCVAFSKRTTDAPPRAAHAAADEPAGPAPITAMSTCSMAQLSRVNAARTPSGQDSSMPSSGTDGGTTFADSTGITSLTSVIRRMMLRCWGRMNPASPARSRNPSRGSQNPSISSTPTGLA